MPKLEYAITRFFSHLILSFGGQLAQPDPDICQLLGVDTRRITHRNLSSWQLDVKENEEALWETLREYGVY